MSIIPAKDIVYLIIIAAIAFGMVWWHHDAVVEGRNQCQSQLAEAVAQQRIKDAQTAQETTDALNLEISRLRSATAPADVASPVRVQCFTARKVPAAASLAGATRPTEPAATGGSVSAMPTGSDSNRVDIWPGLQFIATAGAIESAYHRACLKELKEP